MREALHRLDDRGHARDPVHGSFERRRDPLEQVLDVCLLLRLVHRAPPGLEVDARVGEKHLAIQAGERQQLVDRLVDERHRVRDELQRCVDLVRDAGGELADGLEPLRHAPLKVEALALALELEPLSHIARADQHAADRRIVAQAEERRLQ